MIYLESSPKIKGCAPPSSTHRKTKKCIPDCEFSSFINFLFYLFFCFHSKNDRKTCKADSLSRALFLESDGAHTTYNQTPCNEERGRQQTAGRDTQLNSPSRVTSTNCRKQSITKLLAETSQPNSNESGKPSQPTTYPTDKKES
jgi:hypothetical protein